MKLLDRLFKKIEPRYYDEEGRLIEDLERFKKEREGESKVHDFRTDTTILIERTEKVPEVVPTVTVTDKRSEEVIAYPTSVTPSVTVKNKGGRPKKTK